MTEQAGAHTPGPWIVQETEYGHEIRMGEAIKITNFHESHLVIEYNHMCELGDDSEENAQYYEAEANARLIASAPAMAEELALLREEVSHLGSSRALALDRQLELQAENNTLRAQKAQLVEALIDSKVAIESILEIPGLLASQYGKFRLVANTLHAVILAAEGK